MPGHYVAESDAIVDIEVGMHLLTLRSPRSGKIMRCRDVGTVVAAGDVIAEVTGVGTETWELFVAYRRKDAPGHAGRVGDRLIAHFGPGQVFKDIESLAPGVDFKDVIRAKLQLAFAMVVIIGPRWAADPRLQRADDFHRNEIITAIERGIRMVPALVDGAAMPSEDQLPDDIRALARPVAVEITDTRWDYDVGRLIKCLEGALADSPRRKRFLAQVPAWGYTGGVQWIEDEPSN